MSRIGWERAEDREELERFEEEGGLRGRLFFLRLLILVTFASLLSYIIYLQQNQGDSYTAQALDRQFAILTTDAPRGVVFDRNDISLVENIPSFDVSITPAFLPKDETARQAIYERLSLLTGVPITNTVEQQFLIDSADPLKVATISRLADLYGQPTSKVLNDAGVVPLLPQSITSIIDTYSFAQYLPAVITTSIPITLARIIQQETIFMPGVQVLARPVRNYPTGAYTSHIIGFMGPLPDRSYYVDQLGYELDDRVGLFGIESSMEDKLKGVKGSKQIEVDSTGRRVRQIGVDTPPVAGYNLHLTIDFELQKIAQDILVAQMEEKRNAPDLKKYPEVEQGVVAALNPKNGEILALVNIPTFDNQRFATKIDVDYYLQLARNDYYPLLNNAIAGQYPPGSVFKMVTAAAALQEGIVSPARRLRDPGVIVIPNRFAPNDPGRAQKFVCWIYQQKDPLVENSGEHGYVDVYRALADSCDVYFYKVSGGFDQDGEKVDTLGIERLRGYAEQFGFNRTQGIELPAEAGGLIPSKAWKSANLGSPWSTGDDYNSAIGQGYILATPLQIAQMTGVIANGGSLYRPTVIHHYTDAKGRIVVFDANDQPVFATPNSNGVVYLEDAKGNPIDPSSIDLNIQFDAEGNYIRPPELLNKVEVEKEYLDAIAEGMYQATLPGGTAGVIGRQLQDDFTYDDLSWFMRDGIKVAGKTGTAEFCDSIAQTRGWCAVTKDQLQPTHAWYVGYGPLEDPEIVVAAFIFNGGEGSAWAAPIVYKVMQAYFKLGPYAEQSSLANLTTEIRP